MSATGAIEVALRGRLGTFELDVAFTAPATGVTALSGPSGCGKTTVLRCMAGLTRVAQGTCVVDGEIWQDESVFVPPHRRRIGYVFQEASLFPHLSVERNLLFGARRQRPAESHGQIGVDGIVRMLGLSRLLDRAPKHLSGGERQRVAIGRALASKPKLLLMDEPLSALDRHTRAEILPFLEEIQASLRLPIIYVSHDMMEVERLADTLVLIEGGRVQAVGPLAALQSDPALPLAGAREAAVSIDARIVDVDETYGLTTLAAGNARFAVPGIGGKVGQCRRLRVAAADVSLSRVEVRHSTILNSLPVRVVGVSPVGQHEIVAVLQADGGLGPKLLARVTRLSWDRLQLAEGAAVHAQIKSVALVPGAAPSPPDREGPRHP